MERTQQQLHELGFSPGQVIWHPWKRHTHKILHAMNGLVLLSKGNFHENAGDWKTIDELAKAGWKRMPPDVKQITSKGDQK